jgi:glycine cleavage system H protein
MPYPKEYKYTREHEWINPKGKTALVGITDFAQQQLGDIVFVELPKAGSLFDRGKAFGTVESVKAVSELYSPVSGKVTAINEELNDAPEDINSDAHAAWIIELELKDTKELDSLLSAAEYEAYVAEEQAH